jgi:hypothetical protein
MSNETTAPYLTHCGLPDCFTTLPGTNNDTNRYFDDINGRRFLEEIGSVNIFANSLCNYSDDLNGLPDSFMLFAIVDKLKLANMAAKCAMLVKYQSDAKVYNLENNTAVSTSLKNVEDIFSKVDDLLKKIRDIAIDLPPSQHTGQK